MPSTIPRIDAPLPSLLDDLPGQAIIVVNPKISTLNVPVEEWSDLQLLFFGADGRWRRLSLGDLGLSDALIYSDTYGAGSLSSDGRWWAGQTDRGLIALNLTTGAIRLIPTEGSYGTPAWLSPVDPTRGQFAETQLRGRGGLAVVVADSEDDDVIAELRWTRRDFELVYDDTWLDEKTLLIATAPHFMVWRPATGNLFRVTDASSLGDYWEIGVAPKALAR